MTPSLSLGEPGDLTGFPTVPPPAELVRVCRATNATWWFSSDGAGRFDLVAPHGTCYFATDEYAAIRESSRLGPVSPTWVAGRELRRVDPADRAATLAGTTRKAAGRFGVTAELATVVPYALPRRWAAAFRDHGFHGIRHQLRHDPRARPSGVAWFGPAGASGHADGASTPLTHQGMDAAGVDVIPIPPAAVLTILP